MSDQATQRDRIRAVIGEWVLPGEHLNDRDIDVLADRIDKALSLSVTGTGESQALPPITQGERTGQGLVGPVLSPDELAEILGHDLWTEAEQTALIRHLAALNATIATQNREMDDQQRRVRELEALQSEVVRALYLTPLDEVMGRNVMADEVKLIAELLRAAQAEREARR